MNRLTSSVLMLAGVLGAQTVKQGEASAVPVIPNAFNSPMVIETVFPAADPSLWMEFQSLEEFKPGKSTHGKLGKWFSVPEWYALGKFTCDGVSLREEAKKNGTWEEPGLRMRVRWLGTGAAERAEVTVEATLYNPKNNHDKMVTLHFEVLSGENSIAVASLTMKAPDNAKSGNNGDVTFVFSKDELRSAMKLRITITTKDY